MTDHLTAEQIQNHLNGLTLEGGSVAEAVAELLKEQRNQIIERIEGLAGLYEDTAHITDDRSRHIVAKNLRNLANNLKGNDR